MPAHRLNHLILDKINLFCTCFGLNPRPLPVLDLGAAVQVTTDASFIHNRHDRLHLPMATSQVVIRVSLLEIYLSYCTLVFQL